MFSVSFLENEISPKFPIIYMKFFWEYYEIFLKILGKFPENITKFFKEHCEMLAEL